MDCNVCQYRIYCVKADGSFSGAENVECTNDEAALGRAVDLFGSVHAEIWQAARLVGIVNAPTAGAPERVSAS
jgi:hypothetical protein